RSGPATGWIYPPLATLAYWPATLVPDPTGAVLAGRLLSLVFFFAPAAWLLLTDRGDRTRPTGLTGVLLFGCFAMLTNQSRPLRYCSTEIHADAPALGLAAVAVGLMARSRPEDRPWRMGVALILATLSVWTKQLTAPVLVIILPLWAYLTRGVQGVVQYLGMAVSGGLAIALLLLAVFDARPALFNFITVPLLHPSRFESLEPALSRLLYQEQRQVVLLLLLAAGGLGQLAIRARRRGGPGGGLTSEPWTLALLVALAELPISLMAYVKLGGDDNNLGFMLYFLTLAGLLMHSRLMTAGGALGGADRATASFRGIFVVNLVLTLLIAQEIALAFVKPGPTWQEQQAAALRYIERHRGEVYFPWNPLEHLVVEGRLYHYEYGVFDRILAGYPPSLDHFLRDIPPRTRLVCYPPRTTVGDQVTLRYLQEFREQIHVDELPDWECYRRPEPTPAPERDVDPPDAGNAGPGPAGSLPRRSGFQPGELGASG
ncbi:MAG TPA: hypothetical protein VFF52_13235, partial [Isosphaeraceae bacterium]|nr:hypothetical protein [Isosphaeraceae bacterium]